MQSKASTVAQYLSELPADRREILQAVRRVILANLNKGFEEGMQYGMIGYFVPHKLYPPGYHCNPKEPLPFAALASQKNYCSLYLMTLYGEGAHWKSFEQEWAKTGKKLDMGKCCIRFKRIEDLALDIVARALSAVTVDEYVGRYEKSLAERAASTPKSRPARARASGGEASTKKAVTGDNKKTAPGSPNATMARKAGKRKT